MTSSTMVSSPSTTTEEVTTATESTTATRRTKEEITTSKKTTPHTSSTQEAGTGEIVTTTTSVTTPTSTSEESTSSVVITSPEHVTTIQTTVLTTTASVSKATEGKEISATQTLRPTTSMIPPSEQPQISTTTPEVKTTTPGECSEDVNKISNLEVEWLTSSGEIINSESNWEIDSLPEKRPISAEDANDLQSLEVKFSSSVRLMSIAVSDQKDKKSNIDFALKVKATPASVAEFLLDGENLQIFTAQSTNKLDLPELPGVRKIEIVPIKINSSRNGGYSLQVELYGCAEIVTTTVTAITSTTPSITEEAIKITTVTATPTETTTKQTTITQAKSTTELGSSTLLASTTLPTTAPLVSTTAHLTTLPTSESRHTTGMSTVFQATPLAVTSTLLSTLPTTQLPNTITTVALPTTTPLPSKRLSTILTTSTVLPSTRMSTTLPTTTPLASTRMSTTLPTTTPLASTRMSTTLPMTTPLASTRMSTILPTTTPLASTRMSTTLPTTTPLASTRMSTTLPTTTPLASTRMSTTLPMTTPLASTRMSTTLPTTTPLASTRMSTTTTPLPSTRLSTTLPTSTVLPSTRVSTTLPITTPLASTRQITTMATTPIESARTSTAVLTTTPLASTRSSITLPTTHTHIPSLGKSTTIPTTIPLVTRRITRTLPTTSPVASTTVSTPPPITTQLPRTSESTAWPTSRMVTTFPVTTHLRSTASKPLQPVPGQGGGSGQISPGSPPTQRNEFAFSVEPTTLAMDAAPPTSLIATATALLKTALPQTTSLASTIKSSVLPTPSITTALKPLQPLPGEGTGNGEISQGTPSTQKNEFAFSAKPKTSSVSSTLATTSSLPVTTLLLRTALLTGPVSSTTPPRRPTTTPHTSAMAIRTTLFKSTSLQPFQPVPSQGVGNGQIFPGSLSTQRNEFAFSANPATSIMGATSATTLLSTTAALLKTALPTATPVASARISTLSLTTPLAVATTLLKTTLATVRPPTSTRSSTTLPATTQQLSSTRQSATPTTPLATTPLRSITSGHQQPVTGQGGGSGQISQETPSTSRNEFLFSANPTTLRMASSTTLPEIASSLLKTALPATHLPTTATIAPGTTITTTTTFPSATEKVTTVKEVTVTPSSTTTTIITTQVPLEESTGSATTEASTTTTLNTVPSGGGPVVVAPPGHGPGGSIGIQPVTSNEGSFVFTGTTTQASNLTASTEQATGSGPVVVAPPGGSSGGVIGTQPVTSNEGSFVFTGPSTTEGPIGGRPITVPGAGGSINGSIGTVPGTTTETSFRLTGQTTSAPSVTITYPTGPGPASLLPPGGVYNGSIGVQPGKTDETSFIFTEQTQLSPTSTVTKTVITSPTEVVTKEITVSSISSGSTTENYCIEGTTGTEKERFTSPDGMYGQGYIDSDVAWSLTAPKSTANREARPKLTVVFEDPVRLVGVDLQGNPDENIKLMYAIAIQTEENGDFDKFVGRLTNIIDLQGDSIEHISFDSSDISSGVRQARLEVRAIFGKATEENLRVAFHSCREESISTEVTTTVAKTTTVPTLTTTPSSTSEETTTVTVSISSTSTKTITETSTKMTSFGPSTTKGDCMDLLLDREANRIASPSNQQVALSTFSRDEKYSFSAAQAEIYLLFNSVLRITAIDLFTEGVKNFAVFAGSSFSDLKPITDANGQQQEFTIDKSSEFTRITLPDVQELQNVRAMKLQFFRSLDSVETATLKTELVGCVKELPSEKELLTTLEVTVEAPLTTEATTTEKKETKSVTTTAEEVITDVSTTTKTTLNPEGTSTQQPQAGVPSASTSKTSSVKTTVPTTPGSMETTKEETTTTAVATTETETTTKTTSTAKITQLATLIPKENCNDVLTPFMSQSSMADGPVPSQRRFVVPFTTPVTITELTLQGDTQGNAIMSFTVSYRLYEEDSTRELQDDSGLQIFNVPWDVDVTDPVTISLPFTKLENVIEVTLTNLNVPENKQAIFTAEFHGCVNLPIITPSITTMLTSTTSTTTAPTSTTPEMLNTMLSSTVTTTTAKVTTTEVTRQTVKAITEPEKLCDKDLSRFDGTTVTRSTDLGTLGSNEPWRPSDQNRRLTISFEPPVVVQSLTAEQDDDFDFIAFYILPSSNTRIVIKDANGIKTFSGGADQVRQYLPEDVGEIGVLELFYRSTISADPQESPEVMVNLFGCFDHLTTTAVTTTVSKLETMPAEAKSSTKPSVEIKTTTERVSVSPTQKVTVTATSIPGRETSTVKETITSSETVTESVMETKELGVTTYTASTTVTSQKPLTTTLGICMENLETSPAFIGMGVERTTSMPYRKDLSSFRLTDVWMPSISDGTVPFVRLESDHPLRLNALKMAGDGQGNGVTKFRLKYLPAGSQTEVYYTDSTSGEIKTFTGRLMTTKSDSPVLVYLDKPTEPAESLTIEIIAYQGTQPALRVDFFGCAGHSLTTTRKSTFERITSPQQVITTVTESINNVVTSTRQTVESLETTTQATTEETQTPHVGVTIAPSEEEGGTTETTTTTESTTTEATGCMYNGRMYQYGEELPSRDPCTRMLCELGSGILEIREECDLRCDGKLRYIEEQCCPVCEKESKQCLRESRLETLRIGNCISEDPVEYTSCTGGCPSRAFVDMLPGSAELRNDCQCCQPMSMGVRETRMNCDGVIQEYSYQVIETCSCTICTSSQPNNPDQSNNSPNGR
ncbi:mucin-17-like [Acanthaster planci]|uniref:Mucin-17-like n=1 Tax=Acanthaster planci TaxID=133434 RepID=A0A8B7YC82_ACAPL|nr:mucin-17-like [Acanthaster planci]